MVRSDGREANMDGDAVQVLRPASQLHAAGRALQTVRGEIHEFGEIA